MTKKRSDRPLSTLVMQPSRPATVRSRPTSIDGLREQMLKSRPSFRARWEATKQKREIAVSLARLRATAGLTQTVLAKITGWDKAFVSRLESAAGPIPDMATLSKYGQACGAAVGIVFAKGEPDHMRIVESIMLSAAQDNDPFEKLRDDDLTAAAIATKLDNT